jgi:uncharacterized membrane protein
VEQTARIAQARTVESRSRAARLRFAAPGAVYVVWAAYAAVFAGSATIANAAFGAARLDLGNAVQAIWSTAHGRFLETTDTQGVQIVRLGSHVDPLLALFAPLWRVWPSPTMLVVAQALAVSAGVLPVYRLARKHLGSERAAVSFALVYLMYPATQWNAFSPGTGFHAVSFAVPLLLYAIWFLDEERWAWFAVTAVLVAASKEQMPLVVGCLGIWYGVTRRRPAVGAAIFFTGLTLTAVDFLYVIPHFSPTGVTPFAGRYADVGGTPAGILETLFKHPGRLVVAAFTLHKLAFVLLLFLPFLGLWLRAPLLLLGALPDLAINLLSSDGNMTRLGYQYTAAIAPLVLAATIFGASRLRVRPETTALWVFVAVGVTAFLSPLWTLPHLLRDANPANGVHEARVAAVKLVPPGAPVSSSVMLGGRLSARRRIFTFPVVREARWIVLDPRTSDKEAHPKEFDEALGALRRDSRFRLVFSSHGLVVFRRV